MPVIAYAYRPEDMYVNSEDYFSYTIPVLILLSLGLKSMNKHNRDHNKYIENIKKTLEDHSHITYVLFVIGIVAVIIQFFVPVSLKQITNLFANCLYTSLLYNHYSGNNKRHLISTIIFLVMLVQTVREGMFGHFFSWGVVWLPYLLIGKKWCQNFSLKFIIAVSIFTLLPVIQGVKFQYRKATWVGVNIERQGDSALLYDLFINRLGNYEELLDLDILYSSFNRLNQGGILAKAMNYVPFQEPYANGEILLSFIYPFIPRLVWDEKPVTGGFQNMKRFTGIENESNNSSNISPVGEAYVNFGPIGGIVFMWMYGLFFGFIFKKLFEITLKKPSLFLWIPSLFIAGILSETDILSVWGTCATGIVFLGVLYFISKRLNITI
ncbi:hypothetical protein [Fibrella arboris]|uniref:hypothetical protein n=1 Tax=Fibrella arboris TaxID=3242486 RepID=UPI0035216AF9